MLANPTESVLVIVDMQPKFMAPIHNIDTVMERVKFLARCARELEIPILATEQYPERMGETDEGLMAILGKPAIPKMAFSCMGCNEFHSAITELGNQAVLCGIETHICVNQTAQNLLHEGYDVVVAEDAVSARSGAMHQNGIARMRSEEAVIAHSESIAYEWMGSADNPKFKDILNLVKAFPAS